MSNRTTDERTERYYAEMEAARNESEEAYFTARATLLDLPGEGELRRVIFRDGFQRAFKKLWNELEEYKRSCGTLETERQIREDIKVGSTLFRAGVKLRIVLERIDRGFSSAMEKRRPLIRRSHDRLA